MNFNFPYCFRSITEFWRRWHISLSTWFRDYLYIPLGGNRFGALRTYRNLLIVFVLCGFWHGASWNFLAWGIFHGLFLVIERVGGRRWLGAWPAVLQHSYTLVAVSIGWVFFRSETLSEALTYCGALVGSGSRPIDLFHFGMVVRPDTVVWGIVGVLCCVPTGKALSRVAEHQKLCASDGAAGVARIAAIATILVLVSLSLASGTHNPFIYYRF